MGREMTLREWMGIDVGTSGIKVVIIDERAKILKSAYRAYDVLLTEDGGAEQSPELWWNSLLDCLYELDCSNVSAIGLSGQMHGLVAIDADGKLVHNAILWNDRRSVPQANEADHWLSHHANGVLNRMSSGFLFSSLLWMKENHPDSFKKIRHVMLPKDYLIFRLTGVICTDSGDASGTGAYNILEKTWEERLLKAFGIPIELFPPIKKAIDVAGETRQKFGTLKAGVPVSCGSGDHAMQLIGNGVFDCGAMNCNLGTAGQLSITIDSPCTDLSANLFCHAVDKKYNLVGATLNGGIVLKWLAKILQKSTYKELDNIAESIPAGSCGVILLPYINGERVPYHNPNLKASFHGLSYNHTQAHLVRAAMEGVIFNIRDINEMFKTITGLLPDKIIASGGGARSRVWLQMQSDILHKEIYVSTITEQAAVGAASIAGIASRQIEQYEIFNVLSSNVYVAAKPDYHAMLKYDDYYKRYCDARKACSILYGTIS